MSDEPLLELSRASHKLALVSGRNAPIRVSGRTDTHVAWHSLGDSRAPKDMTDDYTFI